MTKNNIQKDEQGIVAILVTMIIMIVLSLMVTGFAQLARREQRESLDRQLASQAFYAAESGINDARRAMAAGYTKDKKTCEPTSDSAHLSDNKVSSDGVISYSCLLIKQNLEQVNNVISTEESRIIPMNAVTSDGNPRDIENFTISWKAQGGGVSLPSRSVGEFPPVNAWGGPNTVGVLRVDVIPIINLNAPSLDSNMVTFFAYPTSGPATSIGPGANGQVVGAGCGSGNCQINLNSMPATSKYYVRLKAIYNAADVRMCLNACNGTTLIQGAGAEVDVTGKANDVLKRIKVMVGDGSAVANMDNFPEYVVTSKNSICKKLEVWPGGADPGTAACSP